MSASTSRGQGKRSREYFAEPTRLREDFDEDAGSVASEDSYQPRVRLLLFCDCSN